MTSARGSWLVGVLWLDALAGLAYLSLDRILEPPDISEADLAQETVIDPIRAELAARDKVCQLTLQL